MAFLVEIPQRNRIRQQLIQLRGHFQTDRLLKSKREQLRNRPVLLDYTSALMQARLIADARLTFAADFSCKLSCLPIFIAHDCSSLLCWNPKERCPFPRRRCSRLLLPKQAASDVRSFLVVQDNECKACKPPIEIAEISLQETAAIAAQLEANAFHPIQI